MKISMKVLLRFACVTATSTAFALDFTAPIEKIGGGFTFTEGPIWIAFTPDEKVLYVNDTERGHIRAFDVAPDGTLANSRIFTSQAPGADGMKVDTEGNVYCACKPGVMVFDSTGKYLHTISTPERPANLAFGGSDWKTLYITCRPSLYRVHLTVPGVKN